MTAEPRVVVVGGGLGAVRTAQTVRDLGHTGELRILSAEHETPYDRPPLSKDHLSGALPDSGLALIPHETYTELGIGLELGREIVGLDADARVLTAADGSDWSYDRLVVATGARARPLPVLADRPGAGPLRTADDSRRLAGAIRAGGRIVVVGGGFIGLEVAATARTAGCPVTVVEMQSAPLLGAVGSDVAGWLQARHEAAGVVFHCGVGVTAAGESSDGAERLELSDGTVLTADAVVVGVGVVRDVGWLADAGLETADGLVCDEHGRTSRPDVFAVGDVACRRRDTVLAPIAHWTAAGTSARRAAHALLGLDVPDLPDDAFFWSDQFGLRIQCAGAVAPDSELVVVAGDMTGNSFVAQFRSAGEMTGVIAVNDPRQFLRNRKALRKPAEAAP